MGGERIVDRVVQAARAATGGSPLIVTSAPQAEDWLPDLEVIPDAIPNCGSLGGIYTALTAGDGPVLVLAWDMPFVSPQLLGALVRGSHEFDVFLPESDGPLGVEPLCAVYGPRCAAPILASLEAEDFRTTAFHAAVSRGTLARAEVARFGKPAVLFFNVNHVADLATAEEIRAGRPAHEPRASPSSDR